MNQARSLINVEYISHYSKYMNTAHIETTQPKELKLVVCYKTCCKLKHIQAVTSLLLQNKLQAPPH
jgi:hypothetical protein